MLVEPRRVRLAESRRIAIGVELERRVAGRHRQVAHRPQRQVAAQFHRLVIEPFARHLRGVLPGSIKRDAAHVHPLRGRVDLQLAAPQLGRGDRAAHQLRVVQRNAGVDVDRGVLLQTLQEADAGAHAGAAVDAPEPRVEAVTAGEQRRQQHAPDDLLGLGRPLDAKLLRLFRLVLGDRGDTRRLCGGVGREQHHEDRSDECLHASRIHFVRV